MADVLNTIIIYPLELLFEVIFVLANRAFDNPVLSIVVLSLTVNFLVLPLYNRADEMQKQQREAEEGIKDGVDKIKYAFKGDERMMMLQAYYRENHYSPLYVFKDSVPLLLQVPFFIAAYQFLSGLELLNDTSLGPINSLGSPDKLFIIAGFSVNILPILMTLINLVSGWIYSKGISFKAKLQMYLLALVFLVLLYNSPSGLVFYWTLNNIFSLCKNIVYKIIEGRGKKSKKQSVNVSSKSSDTVSFLLSGLFLTVFIGFFIPSDVIKSSIADFINYLNLKTPNLYVVHSGLTAFGCFVVWGGIFYAIAGKAGRIIISRIWTILCFTALVTYLFFGNGHGILTRTLEYEKPFINTISSIIINLIVCIVIAVVLIFVTRKFGSISVVLLLVVNLVCIGMTVYNMNSIHKDYLSSTEDLSFDIPSFPLSTEGKNVMVIMLDRACGYLVPYIFDELPYLEDQFDGFTFYPNTVSFGSYTKTATPAMFGGYDYTPQAIASDSDKTLRETQNEALSVMPLLFRDAGYEVTVCDPPYAGYQQVPDLSVFEQPGYEGINAYITADNPYFDDCDYNGQRENVLNRNLFCYSLMKVCPLMFQSILYDYGKYNAADMSDSVGAFTIPQRITDVSHSVGVNQESMNSYNILSSLADITDIVDGNTDTFMYIDNLLPHSPMFLQEPEYAPAQYVDNSEYDAAHTDRFHDIGAAEPTFDTNSTNFWSHYHSNTAAYILLGQYFDYLRQMGVWDNTRIIIVADHGIPLLCRDTTIPNCYDEGFGNRIDGYNPVFMVKDFGSTGFTINEEVITNADLPYVAVNGLIDNPVNPFTGNPIIPLTEFDGVICAYDSWDVNVETDTGATGDDVRFIDGYWFVFDGTNVLDRSSWYLVAYG